ncbi:MAG: N-acetylmuramoyl-L-alanine amidase [Candidatus Paceibacterota bacterium]
MKRLLFIFSILSLFFIIPFSQIGANPAVPPIKILLVPGHDSVVWGAQYGNTKEANMNLAVASRINNILKKDKRFEILITRDNEGYVKEFADYFSTEHEQIVSFRESAKKVLLNLIDNGFFLKKETVPHNRVNENTSIVLYGINKWANENNIDAVIHIHFNDYPRKSKWTIGKYFGFVIYIPDGQMENSFESGQLGADIYTQLHKKYTTSTYEKELGGLIQDQSLIALGSNGTLSSSTRSILIEYGYVSEKKFRNYTTRHKTYDDMATLTAKGIKNYFFVK